MLPQLEHLPAPETRRIALHVSPAAERALRQGHSWLFAESIRQQSHAGQPGDFAVVFDKKDRFLAIGLYDPESPVRVKVLHHGQTAPIDAAWFAAKIQQAAKIREHLPAEGTTGCRLIHGENDGLPGLIADRYASTLVLKLYTAAWLPHLRTILPTLVEISRVERSVLRLSRQLQTATLYGLHNGLTLHGQSPDEALIFTENGLRFEVDVRQGHKTGFFCDHRENRARVKRLAQGKRVLDVFAYTGAFSLYAAAGGAQEILSVDISVPALAAAQRNFALNQHLPAVAAAKHTILAGDAFAALERMNREHRQFEMVIIDPPTFAGSSDQIPQALEAYRRLVELALPLVTSDGLLVMASCSSRVSADVFFATVHETARQNGYRLDEIERTGHAVDHPITFPEGAYLKCLFARVAG